MAIKSTSKPKILILYSNPSNTARLRLDKEHRAIDGIIQRLNLESNIFHRLHATTIEDFAHVLRENNYDIVQFSGHGSNEGIVLEDNRKDGGTLLSAKQVADILRTSAPNIKATLFISCFSASSIPDLIESSPYLITISESADDDLSIEFISEFYDSYFRSGSIQTAFKEAQLYVSLINRDSNLTAVLSRRAIEKGASQVLFQVFPSGKDSILIDLTEAESDIENLDISKEDFLSLLSRKIRIHKWVFDSPRERAILSIGPFFGLFSWKNASDVVNCHKILQVKSEVDEKTCEVWASLIVSYNDHFAEKYRSAPPYSSALESSWIKKAIDDQRITFNAFFEKKETSEVLKNIAPEQYKVTKSLLVANLDMCDRKFHDGDYKSTVLYLESTLSAIHDMVDALTAKLAK